MDAATAEPGAGQEPVGEGGQLPVDPANPEGQKPPEPSTLNEEQLRLELTKIQERYAHSSSEGKRLYQENKQFKERFESLEKEVKARSLTPPTTTQAPPALPDEEVIVKYKMEEVGMDEKSARHAAKVELGLLSQMRVQQVQMQALNNQIRLQTEQQTRLAVESNPIFKEAEEFFREWPEMQGMPPVEKVERYRTLREKMVPRIAGRDTTAAKSAAGSPAGSSSGSPPNASVDLDAQAKTQGYQSWKQMEDMARCKTQSDFNDYRRKYGIK